MTQPRKLTTHEKHWLHSDFPTESPRCEALYEKRVKESREKAALKLSTKITSKDPFPSLDTLKTANETIFEDVYRCAGQLRSELQSESPGDLELRVGKQHDAAFSKNVGRNVEELNAEARGLWSGATNDQDKARVLVYYHAKLDLIQPFADGNTRTTLELLDAQAQACLGKSLDWTMSLEGYRAAREKAWTTGDLNSLAMITIGVDLGPSKDAQTPIVLWPQDVEKTTADGLVYYVSANDPDHAEALAGDTVSTDTSDYVRLRGTEDLVFTPDEDGKLQLDPGCKLALEEAREVELSNDLVARKEDLRTQEPEYEPDD